MSTNFYTRSLITPAPTLPITFKAHQIAQKFFACQNQPKKAKQVYLNTLAVAAVSAYLNGLGIATEIDAGDSWDPIMQTLADTADLKIKNWGVIECRPVLPEAEFCEIPAEVWQERRGYIAVQLNRELSEATLLGFLPRVEELTIPLKQFKPLETFLSYFHQSAQPRINLGHWLQNTAKTVLQESIETGWERLENLLYPQRPAFRFRRAPEPQTLPKTAIQQGKRLRFGQGEEGKEVIFSVAIAPNLEKETDSDIVGDLDIVVAIYATPEQTYLPQDLKLLILDDTEEVVMSAIARSTKNIQIEFSGEPGEQFSVKVVLGETSIAEWFVI